MTTRIGAYDPKQAKYVLDTVRALAKERGTTQGIFQPYTPTPIYFKNRSTSLTIPAFGCIQMVGTEDIDGTTYLLVDRPFDFTDSVVGPFLLNGPGECEPSGIGMAQWGPIFRAIKDSSTYSVGTRLGPTSDSYALSKGCLFSYAGNDSQEENLTKVIACETPIIGVTSQQINAGSFGSFTAKQPGISVWSAGTISYTGYNVTPTDIANNKPVIAFPIDAKWVVLELC